MRVTPYLAFALCASACDAPQARSHAASSTPSALPAPSALVRERCAGDCSAEIVLRGQREIRSLAIAGGRTFWGSWRIELEPNDSVQMLAARGAPPKRLASGLHGVCALEVDDEYVYLIEPGLRADGSLRRVPLAGGKPELLVTQPGACGMALTPREVVYASAGKLQAIPKRGGSARVLGKAAPFAVVRALGETLYWSSEDGVYRSRGGPAERVLSTKDVYAIAITREYLVVQRGGADPGIVRARHDGGDSRLLYGGDVDALAADDSHAFFATSEGGARTIRRIALLDGEMTLLARRPQQSATAIALDDTHVYFTDPAEGLLLRVAK